MSEREAGADTPYDVLYRQRDELKTKLAAAERERDEARAAAMAYQHDWRAAEQDARDLAELVEHLIKCECYDGGPDQLDPPEECGRCAALARHEARVGGGGAP